MRTMKSAATYLMAVLIACLLAACGRSEVGADSAAYEADILEWRKGRVERLKGPDGFLNLVGLYWLDARPVRIGSAADNDIVFPAAAAPYVGTLRPEESGVWLDTEPGVDVRHGGEPVASILIADDTTDEPVTVTHGSLAWAIIKRDDRFALRLRDYERPAIAALPPIESYPIDRRYRVAGVLRAFAEPRILNVNTTIEGLGYHPRSPGKIVFELDGQALELEAYESGDSLFFVFADQTTGRETYPAGRFLYAEQPDEDGITVLDFNKAYNPPCAFNEFATCPVASPRNRLSVRIEAGEKYDPRVHKPVAATH
jgi:uncharacterized protein (DUF1684 family)